MSHITPVATRFRDLECLAEACRELGLTLEQGSSLIVRDYYGNTVPVAARALLGQYAIGFQREIDGTLKMVADFWGIRNYCNIPKVRLAIAGVSEEQGLVRMLEKPYAIAAAMKEVRTNTKYRGFAMREERNAAGEVERLVLVRRRY